MGQDLPSDNAQPDIRRLTPQQTSPAVIPKNERNKKERQTKKQARKKEKQERNKIKSENENGNENENKNEQIKTNNLAHVEGRDGRCYRLHRQQIQYPNQLSKGSPGHGTTWHGAPQIRRDYLRCHYLCSVSNAGRFHPEQPTRRGQGWNGHGGEEETNKPGRKTRLSEWCGDGGGGWEGGKRFNHEGCES